MKIKVLPLNAGYGALMFFFILAGAIYGVLGSFSSQYLLRSPLAEVTTSEAVLYIQFKEPAGIFFPKPYNISKAFKIFSPQNIFRGESNFVFEILPVIDREFAVAVVENKGQYAPVFLFRSKRHRDISRYLEKKHGLTTRRIGKDIYVFSQDPIIELSRYFGKNMKNSLFQSGKVNFSQYSPLKVFFNMKHLESLMPQGLSREISNNNITGLYISARPKGRVWNFTAKLSGAHAGDFLGTEEGFFSRRLLQMRQNDDFFVSGVESGVAEEYFLFPKIFSYPEAAEFYVRTLKPNVLPSFDFVISRDFQTGDFSSLFAFQSREDDDKILQMLRDALSYIFPQKQAKKLTDGTMVTEIRVDPSAIHIEYIDASRKIFESHSFPSAFYYYHEKNDIFFSNSQKLLEEHIFPPAQPTESGTPEKDCVFAPSNKSLYFGKHFASYILPIKVQRHPLSRLVEDVFEIRALSVNFFPWFAQGCVL